MITSKIGLRKPDLAFVAQNVRKLSFENRIALGAHVGTLLACFLPWASLEPLYGPAKFMNAFASASWLIGSLVFGLSLLAAVLFIDELFEKNIIRSDIPRTTILGAIGIQSLLLQLCAWSVLSAVGDGYAGIDFGLGLATCLLLQVVALVAVWLRARSSKKEEVKDFFQLPTHGKSGESAANHHTK